MTNYFMLTVKVPLNENRATIGRQPDLRGAFSEAFTGWIGGQAFRESLPVPLEFKLDPNTGDYWTDFFSPSIPLMSKRMVEALAQAGVDNIHTYEAVVLGRDGEPLPIPFEAVNILGRIACADLEASECMVDDPDDPIGVDFDSLVIDEAKTHGQLLFRLHEAPNGIVVHRRVRDHLESAGLRGLRFVDPVDWSG